MTAPAIATPSAEDTPTTAPDAGTPTDDGDALGAELGALMGEGGETPASGDPRGVVVEKVEPATPVATPAAVTPAAAAASPATADAPSDPMAGTQPFMYGAGKKIDGVFVIPATADDPGGVIIPTANMHILQSLAEERDALDASSKEFQDAAQQYERLSEWSRVDADGKEQTISGTDGLIEMRLDMTRQAVALNLLTDVLNDPQRMLALLVQDKDGKISIDHSAVRALSLEIKDAARTRADADGAVLRGMVAPRTAPSAPAAAAGAPGTVSAEAAASVIDSSARSVGLDAKGLNEKDRQFLTQQLPRYVRTVTESDRRTQPHLKVGQPIVDASFTSVVQRQLEHRAELAKTATVATAAATENAPKLAAAGLGKPAPKAAPVAPAAPAKPKLSDADKAYRMREAAAAGRRYDPASDE